MFSHFILIFPISEQFLLAKVLLFIKNGIIIFKIKFAKLFKFRKSFFQGYLIFTLVVQCLIGPNRMPGNIPWQILCTIWKKYKFSTLTPRTTWKDVRIYDTQRTYMGHIIVLYDSDSYKSEPQFHVHLEFLRWKHDPDPHELRFSTNFDWIKANDR